MEIHPSIGLISYLISSFLYLFLLIVYFISNYKDTISKQFVLLIVATIVWSLLLSLSQIGTSIPLEMIFSADILRYFTWIYVLQTTIGIYQGKSFWHNNLNPFSRRNALIVFFISLLIIVFNVELSALVGIQSPILLPLMILFSFTVVGLVFVELLFRNTPRVYRSIIIYLCISAGAIFIYDFFIFSNALLIQSIDYEFWSIRGLINVLIAPTLAIAAVRNPSLAPELHVSRQFVFHSTTLVATGIYLFMMSLAGFYIKESSEDWGKVLQSLFLFVALFLLALIFLSPKLKLRIQRYLNTSFRNKYDYRIEWNRFSHTLLDTEDNDSINMRALKSISQIVESQGAGLWIRDNNKYILVAEYLMTSDYREDEPETSDLITFIKQNHDLFDYDKFKVFLSETGNTDHWFLKSRDNWLIIPLWVNQGLFGYVHLKKSLVGMDLDIEDEELMNTIAHHVALSLSLKETDNALQMAQRFKEVNQVTAFLMHDLKTVLSQLTLLVENGKIHRHNPEFIEDMFDTVEHVSQKMLRLVQQLKQPGQRLDESEFKMIDVINDIFASYGKQDIDLDYSNRYDLDPVLHCNKENLTSAIKHIVQNALDSCGKTGRVIVELLPENSSQIQLRVIDTGGGMTREFISERLFQPFDSTKGVSGMGVGAYQSREFFRSIQGDLSVISNPGKGTTFTMKIPVKNV